MYKKLFLPYKGKLEYNYYKNNYNMRILGNLQKGFGLLQSEGGYFQKKKHDMPWVSHGRKTVSGPSQQVFIMYLLCARHCPRNAAQ